MTPEDAIKHVQELATLVDPYARARDAFAAKLQEGTTLATSSPYRSIISIAAPVAPVTPPAPKTPLLTTVQNICGIIAALAAVVFFGWIASKFPTITPTPTPIPVVVQPTDPVKPQTVTPGPGNDVVPRPTLPGAYTGDLYGVLILPANPSQLEASWKATNAEITTAFKNANAIYVAGTSDQPEFTTQGWKDILAKYGPTPVVIFMDPKSGKVIDAIPSVRPTSAADIIAAVRKVRGQ
jgi:hypothetical protein